MIQVIKDSIKLNIKAIQKLETLNPGKIKETSQTIKALITKVNNPRVKMFIGSVKSIKIGLIIAFTTPKTRAAIKADQNPFTLTPGINQELTNKAKVLKSHVIINFINLYLIIKNSFNKHKIFKLS